MTGGSFDSAPAFHNDTAATYYEHSSAPRVNTDVVFVEALRREYPQLHLSIVPRQTCDLIGFANSGNGALAPIDKETDRLSWRIYREPARRLDGYQDALVESVKFGKFMLEFKAKEFVLYIADGRDGSVGYPQITNQYVLSSSAQATENLLLEAGRWTTSLHDEVWVFDQGFWQKSAELYDSIKNAQWSNVILDEGMKKALIDDVDTFFNGRETYQKLKVPWKRGAIYYGPPGNGKTISIKAMMNSLYKRKLQVPTLYVKTLASYNGPEYAIKVIFNQARKFAPCYLVFEDLDTIITAGVRSYFFNEVDGLKNNDGIFMIGSTNHLDRLDPGIAKRPSRFDRKFYFPDPSEDQRVAYAHFWQGKLDDNKDIEFPDELCKAIARITDGFSFAYMQEAFVAALLALAAKDLGISADDDKDSSDSDAADLSNRDYTVYARPGSSARDMCFLAKVIDSDYRRTRCPDSTMVDITNSTIHVPSMTPDEAEHLAKHSLVREVRLVTGKPFDTSSLYLALDDNSGIADLPLWKEIKKVVKILKEEMEEKRIPS